MFNMIINHEKSSFNSWKNHEIIDKLFWDKENKAISQFPCSQVTFNFKKAWPGQLKYLKM